MTNTTKKRLVDLGPKDPNWRNTFLKAWMECKDLEERKIDAEARLEVLPAQVGQIENDNKLTTREKEVEKLNIAYGVKVWKLKLPVIEAKLMLARDNLLRFLGKDWTVERALKVLEELAKLQEEAFKKSEGL